MECGSSRYSERRLVAISNLTMRTFLMSGADPAAIFFLKEFGKVTGIDSSDEALSFARAQGFHKIVKGDSEELPFPDEAFDIVSILDVLEHIDDDKST